MKLSEYREKLRQNPEYVKVENEMAPLREVGNRLLALRLCCNWSHTDLGRLAEIHPYAVEALETGNHPKGAAIEACRLIKFWLDLAYPADVFTGGSGDEGSLRVNDLRQAIKDVLEETG